MIARDSHPGPGLDAEVLAELGIPGRWLIRDLARLGQGGLEAAGLTPARARRFLAALEVGRRAALPEPPRRIASSADAAALVHPWRDRDVESFLVIPLDTRNRLVAGVIEISRGSISACPVSPADVFRAVLREAAAGVVVAHNHPSGDPTPSPEDVTLTERLSRAAEVIGIRLLDHVIVARDGHFSFLDAGLLGRPASATVHASR